MAVPNHHFMDHTLDSIAFRRERALFNGSLDEDVVALLEGHRNAR